MKFEVLYKYGVSPLEQVNRLDEGELYATSCGDIVEYNGEEFIPIIMSPLVPIQGNTVENLTDIQLALYWTLCKNNKI